MGESFVESIISRRDYVYKEGSANGFVSLWSSGSLHTQNTNVESDLPINYWEVTWSPSTTSNNIPSLTEVVRSGEERVYSVWATSGSRNVRGDMTFRFEEDGVFVTVSPSGSGSGGYDISVSIGATLKGHIYLVR